MATQERAGGPHHFPLPEGEGGREGGKEGERNERANGRALTLAWSDGGGFY